MSKTTEHGNNIADQIQTPDVYGDFDRLTMADMWNILDQFQTHIMSYEDQDPMVEIIENWKQELESKDPEVLDQI